MTGLEFGVLGPLQISRGQVPVAVTATRQRVILAALVLQAGHPVSLERLIEIMWAGAEPPSARITVQNYVRRLRASLDDAASTAPGPIQTCPGGYRLVTDPTQVDLFRFTDLVERARATSKAGHHEDAARCYRAALDQWRGDPLSDLAVDGWLEPETTRLVDLRLTATEEWADLEVRADRAGEVVTMLTDLVTRWPLRESLRARLMHALVGYGRTADALHHYRQVRELLVAELGIEPGPLLRAAHQEALRPATATMPRAPEPATTSEGVAASGTSPAQLPAAVAAFAGRDRELACLDALLAGDAARQATLLLAVTGTAGVGKTALAVHWAHRIADQFPDGQLYVNLRGFDPTRPPMPPTEAVSGFLAALSVPAQLIPPDLDAQAALYRSLLAGKRVLVVLDNARDAEQTRPLLPGAPGCLAIVTSRDQLLALVAADGACPLSVDLLTEDEALELLSGRLGAHRVAEESDAVAEIISRCARLPLALAVAAGRAATHPTFSLAVLAKQLRDAAGPLDTLHGGDPAVDVRSVLSWSTQALGADSARLFRLLGLHRGPDLTAAAAASLAGVPLRRAGALLDELTRAHLLTEHHPGRFTLHDLLRAFATEQVNSSEPAEQRDSATHRLLDHYVHTARRATESAHGSRGLLTLDPPRPGVTIEELADELESLAWLTAEHRVLLAAIERAATSGFEGHAWRLAWSLTTHFVEAGHWRDLADAQRLALATAQRTDDRAGQAYAHHGLGCAYTWLSRHDEAHAHFRQSLELFHDCADQVGQARVHLAIGFLLDQQGADDEGLGHDQQALTLFRAAGDRKGQATALNNIGWSHAELGDYGKALVVCREALGLLQQVEDRNGQAAAWDSLGYVYHGLADLPEAITCYQKAIELCRDLGHPYNEAMALTHLGDAHRAGGDEQSSRLAWLHALHLFDQLGHPGADQIRSKLLLVPAVGKHPVPAD